LGSLQIHLFGSFQLTYDHQPIAEFNQARQQAFLAYLLLNAHAPQSRQHLAFLFWPDTGEVQALTNLRNLLYKMRRSLPDAETFLRVDTQNVQWRVNAPFTLDVNHFELLASENATEAELEEALILYRGDLLPTCYDDWIHPWRLRLQQKAMAICGRLIDICEERRAYARAIGFGQQLLNLDPLDETIYRRLMHLHALNGDQAGALRVYHTCATTLQRDLAVEPGPATRALYERLWSVQSPEIPKQPSASHLTPLFGRKDEWIALQRAWRDAAAGKPTCVVITGEAGIGKTRLCEEVVTWVGRQGYPTASAQCFAVEGALAYAPVVAWLRARVIYPLLSTLERGWLAEIARLLPELVTDDPNSAPTGSIERWQRQRLFEALVRAMLCSREPLLLFIDDLQWCDRDTLEWIHFLLRFEPQTPLMILATVRQEEVSPEHLLTALLLVMHRENYLLDLELGPLDRDATASLATAVVGQSLSAEQIENLIQQTEGNPLFMVEYARVQAERTQIGEVHNRSISPGHLLTGSSSLPPRIQSVIQMRLAQLSPEARELTDLAATIGREFTFSVLAKASDQNEESLVRSLDELWQRRIVREEGADGYNFTHDMLRQVAYTSLSAARRRLLHRRVAQVLEAVHSPAVHSNAAIQSDRFSGQIATHYELSGQFEQAILFYQRAAVTAQQIFANQDALLYYRRAIALVEGVASHLLPLASDLYERFADLLHLTGSVEEATNLYLRALSQIPHLDPVTQARIYRKIGNTWRDQYRYTEAFDVYQKAEKVLSQTTGLNEQHQPAWWFEWIQVQFEACTVHYWLGQTQAGEDLLQKIEPVVAQQGTVDQQAMFYMNRATIKFRRSRSTISNEMREDLQRWLAFERAKESELSPSVRFFLGFFSLWDRDFKLSEENLLAALHLAEQRADISLQARCLTYLTMLYRQSERIVDAEDAAVHALSIANAAQMPEYIGMARANEAWVAWRRREFGRVDESGRAALVTWDQLPNTHASLPYNWTALWPLIGLALREEQLPTAVEYLHMLLDPNQQRLPDTLVAIIELALHAWDRSELDEANQQIHRSVEIAQQFQYL
jgi:DNA-binding SARP family transcriptional activator/tetratricopeptide (TPR) repeat protein